MHLEVPIFDFLILGAPPSWLLLEAGRHAPGVAEVTAFDSRTFAASLRVRRAKVFELRRCGGV